MYWIITGKSPFYDKDKDIYRQKMRACHLDLESDELFRDISDQCNDLIIKMLTKKPDYRPSIEEVLRHAWLTTFINTNTSAALI